MDDGDYLTYRIFVIREGLGEKMTSLSMEGAPGCLREGDDGEVSCSEACLGDNDHLIHWEFRDHRTGPWQRTGAVVVHGYKIAMFAHTSFTFALMTTGAFSGNICKLFSELKLVTDNLSLG